MKTVLALLALVVSCAAGAQPGGLAYKGVTLRVSKAEFIEKLPLYQCSGERCSFNRVDCQGSSRGIMDKAIFDLYVKRGDECRAGTSFGGTLVLDGMATFEEGVMSEVDLTTPTPQMESLSDAVVAKFGAPTSVDNSPVKTRAGGEFPNWRKTWKVGKDFLTLELRSGRIDEGRVLLVTQERLASVEAARKKSATAASKDL